MAPGYKACVRIGGYRTPLRVWIGLGPTLSGWPPVRLFPWPERATDGGLDHVMQAILEAPVAQGPQRQARAAGFRRFRRKWLRTGTDGVAPVDEGDKRFAKSFAKRRELSGQNGELS